MSFAVNLQSSTFNQTSSFLRLVEHIRRCVHERERTKQQQSVSDYIEHLRRSINENPLLMRVLFRFYATIKSFSSQNNRMHMYSTDLHVHFGFFLSQTEKVSRLQLFLIKQNPN